MKLGRRVVWLHDDASKDSYAVDYPYVTLHAVCRDVSAYAVPCLYCQVRGGHKQCGLSCGEGC